MEFMRTESVHMNCKQNVKIFHDVSKYYIASYNKSLLHEIPIFWDKTTVVWLILSDVFAEPAPLVLRIEQRKDGRLSKTFKPLTKLQGVTTQK